MFICLLVYCLFIPPGMQIWLDQGLCLSPSLLCHHQHQEEGQEQSKAEGVTSVIVKPA